MKLKIITIISLTFISIACASNTFIKKVDSDADGIIEKYIYFKNDKCVKEHYDKDKDGNVDCIVYYDEKGNVVAFEVDTNNDSKMDARDEFFENRTSKSYRDDNKDSKMDRSWITYYDELGNKSYIEYDINYDGIIDSKFSLVDKIRENRINGVWIRDHEKDGKHGIKQNNVWKEIIFEDKKWKIC
jgi:hypothetical protein